jgi:hypothetical protein
VCLASGTLIGLIRFALELYYGDSELNASMTFFVRCHFLHFGAMLFAFCALLFVAVSLATARRRRDETTLAKITWDWQKTASNVHEALAIVRTFIRREDDAKLAEILRTRPTPKMALTSSSHLEQGKSVAVATTSTEHQESTSLMPTVPLESAVPLENDDNEGRTTTKHPNYGALPIEERQHLERVKAFADDMDFEEDSLLALGGKPHQQESSQVRRHRRFHRFNQAAAIILCGVIVILVIIFR